MLARLAIAILVSLAISLAARRARVLSVGGTIAATIVGTLALLAGWKWSVLVGATKSYHRYTRKHDG